MNKFLCAFALIVTFSFNGLVVAQQEATIEEIVVTVTKKS